MNRGCKVIKKRQNDRPTEIWTYVEAEVWQTGRNHNILEAQLFIMYRQTERWCYGTQLNKQADLLYINKQGIVFFLSYTARSKRQVGDVTVGEQYSGRENYGGHFLHKPSIFTWIPPPMTEEDIATPPRLALVEEDFTFSTGSESMVRDIIVPMSTMLSLETSFTQVTYKP